MNEIDLTIKYNELLNLYASLLSLTQKEILLDYYTYNLSLSEIALQRNVSRSAVEDALKKGTNKLNDLEDKLHLLSKRKQLLKIITKMKNNQDMQDICKELEEII